MKITVEHAKLLAVLDHVHGVVERRNTIPILSNVKMDAADGRLSLQATDTDLEITDSIEAEIETPGAVTTTALTLFEIVRKLPPGAQVRLKSDGQGERLNLVAGHSDFDLSCLPVEEFPVTSSDDLPSSFALPAKDLRILIDRTKFAISTEETRYYLNGVFVHVASSDGRGVLRAAATDGHRLACAEVPLPEGATEMPGIIIPRKTVNELRKLIEVTGDPIQISLSETRISFAFDNVILTSKLIDGTFPDYERVIPKGSDKIIKIDRDSMAEAVDRVSAISAERSRAIKLSIAPETLTLSASSADASTATEKLEIPYDGDPLEIGFNAQYLLAILNQIEGEFVQLSLSEAASPTIIRDDVDRSATYVLMPMRV